MPRPPKERWVECLPSFTHFTPRGVTLSDREEICLTVDELEALRLKDLVGLDQNGSARRMNLAQSTYQRVLANARAKLTRAVVEGRELRIQGGRYWVIRPPGDQDGDSQSVIEGTAGPQDLRSCPACGSSLT